MKIKMIVFAIAIAFATQGFAVDFYMTGSPIEPCAPATIQEPAAIAPCESVKIEPCAPVAEIAPCAPVASCDNCDCAAKIVAKRQRAAKRCFLARLFAKRSVTRTVKIESN